MQAPKVLSFERKIDPSDAVLSAAQWENRGKSQRPLHLREKSVRGTISNKLKSSDEKNAGKIDAMIQNPNIQTVDVCTLPRDADTLVVQFTLRILGNLVPSACSSFEYRGKLLSKIEEYKEKFGFSELANRYANNVANGRFLWRNRAQADEIEVHVKHLVKNKVVSEMTFDALDFSLREFRSLPDLSRAIESGFTDGYALLDVTAYARMGSGQEVYPSQEMVMNRAKGDKSKTLYSVDGTAAMHSQKIGNALRTVDDWYQADESVGPISVEPYGSVTSLGTAMRRPASKSDFYSLRDKLMNDKSLTADEHHFVIANLIRGGVFSD